MLNSIHAYLIPTKKVAQKGTDGTTTIKRFTVKDSQVAFCFVGDTISQIEDHLRYLNTIQESIQPFILALKSRDGERFEEFLVYIDGFKLKCTRLLRAVDVCLKMFYLFDIKYPLACEQFWEFLAAFFYFKEHSKKKKKSSTKLSLMLDKLM